jgi:hypothetical protein
MQTNILNFFSMIIGPVLELFFKVRLGVDEHDNWERPFNLDR